MYKSNSVKIVAGVLMLFVFIFSITPKKWLHDVLTHHRDSRSYPEEGSPTISISGFHCYCDNLVVQSPFLNFCGPADQTINIYFFQYQTGVVDNFLSVQHPFSELRGPPFMS